MTSKLIKLNPSNTIIQFTSVAFIAAFLLSGCDKQGAAPQGMAMPAMPVSVVTMQATAVPISAEAVAQTEGAKEVEIRPRVGGILLKKMFEEGESIKAGQAMFLIDPEPYKLALMNAQGELVHKNARVTQTTRESARLKESTCYAIY